MHDIVMFLNLYYPKLDYFPDKIFGPTLKKFFPTICQPHEGKSALRLNQHVREDAVSFYWHLDCYNDRNTESINKTTGTTDEQ